MLLEESNRRQKQLQEIMLDMAEQLLSNEEVENVLDKLQRIYQDNFRHQYSMFFQLTALIRDDGKYSIDFLMENIRKLQISVDEKYQVQDKTYDILYRQLQKINDHLQLEIARYKYYATSTQIDDLNKSVTDALNLVADTREQKEEVREIKNQLITILGIFTAIVVAFVGQMAFSTSVLANMDKATPFQLAAVILAIGFGFINLIFIFTTLLHKINGREKKLTAWWIILDGITGIGALLSFLAWIGII